MQDDYDNPWKDALDAYLPLCLDLLFPSQHEEIDWTRGYTSDAGDAAGSGQPTCLEVSTGTVTV